MVRFFLRNPEIGGTSTRVRVHLLDLFDCGEGLVAANCDAVMKLYVSTTGGEFLDKLSAYSLFCTVLQLADIYYHEYHSVIMMIDDSPLKS